MGLIRAAIITAIVYFAWAFIQQSTWYSQLEDGMRCKVAQAALLGLVFFIELLI